jgi:endonuclease/exonuclease/phosphatase family metal-dependent hydrolase
MKDQVLEVNAYQKGVACVASDHYPVYVKIKPDAPGKN